MRSHRPTRSHRPIPSHRPAARALRVEPLESRDLPAGGLMTSFLGDGVQLNLSGQTVQLHGNTVVDVSRLTNFFSAPDGSAGTAAFSGELVVGGRGISGTFGLSEFGATGGVALTAANARVTLGGAAGVKLGDADGALALLPAGVAGTLDSEAGAGGTSVFGLPGLALDSDTGLRFDLNTTGGAVDKSVPGPNGPVPIRFGAGDLGARVSGPAAFRVSGPENKTVLRVAGALDMTESGDGVAVSAEQVGVELYAGGKRAILLESAAAQFTLDATAFALIPDSFTVSAFGINPFGAPYQPGDDEIGTEPITKDADLGPLALAGVGLVLPELSFGPTDGLNVSTGLTAASAALTFQKSPPPGGEAGDPIHMTATGLTGTFKLAGSVDQTSGAVTGFTASGAFDITADEFEFAVPNVLTATAEQLAIGYDPAASGPQNLITAAAVSVDLPALGLTGEFAPSDTLPALVVSTEGFAFGHGTVTANRDVQIGSALTVSNPFVTLSDFSFTKSGGLSVGGFAVGAAGLTVAPASGSFSASGTDVEAEITFDETGGVAGVAFRAGEITATVGGGLVEMTGSDVEFVPTATGPATMLAFGSATAKVTVGGLALSGAAGAFSVAADGTVIGPESLTVGLDFSADPDAAKAQLKLPSFLPFKLNTLDLEWDDFAADPGHFVITVSASIDGSLGSAITLGGGVDRLVIDPFRLRDGKNPIIGLDGFSVSASGNLFGGEVSGSLVAGIIKLDDEGNIYTGGGSDFADTVLYAGLEGSFQFAGMTGFEIRLGFSERGPLQGYVEAQLPEGILLEPLSGLSVNNFRAGIMFNATPLETPDDPADLRDPEFQPVNKLTAEQWREQLEQQVANQVSGGSRIFILGEGVPDAVAELESGTLAADGALSTAFEDHGYTVVGDAATTVTTLTDGSLWLVRYGQADYYVELVDDKLEVTLARFTLDGGFADGLTDGAVPQALRDEFAAHSVALSGAATVTALRDGKWAIDDGDARYFLTVRGDRLSVTGGSGGSMAALNSVVRIEAGGTLYSAYASENAFKADVDVILTTDGKFVIVGSATLGTQLTAGIHLYGDLHAIAQRAPDAPVQFLFLADFPDPAVTGAEPLATIKGKMSFEFLDANGNLVNPLFDPTPAAFRFHVLGQATVQATDKVRAIIGGDAEGGYGELILTIADEGNATRAELRASGSLSLEGIISGDDLVSAAADLMIEKTGTGPVEVFGAMELNFTSDTLPKFLRDAGLDADADFLLGLNTATNVKQVELSLPGREPATIDLDPRTLMLDGQGTLAFNPAVLNLGVNVSFVGAFAIRISQDLTAAASPDVTVRGDGGLDLDLFLAGRLNLGLAAGGDDFNLLTLDALGLVAVRDVGAVVNGSPLAPQAAGRIDLYAMRGAPGIFEMQGSAELLFNTLGQDFTYVIPDRLQDRLRELQARRGDTNPLPALPAVDGKLAVTVPGRAPALSDGTQPSAGPYAVVQFGDPDDGYSGTDADGDGLVNMDIDVLDAIHLVGNAQLVAAADGFELRVAADASIRTESTGDLFDVVATGRLQVTGAGLVGSLAFAAGFSLPSVEIDAEEVLGINTTGAPQAIALPSDFPPVPDLAPQSLTIYAHGDLIAGHFDLNGTFVFAVGATALTVSVDAGLTMFDLDLFHVAGSAAYYYNRPVAQTGLKLDLDVTLGGGKTSFGTPGFFDISGDLQLHLDTRPASFLADVRGDVRLELLKAITFSGEADITAGVEGGEPFFRLEGKEFEADLFGVATVDASGFFDSRGYFQVAMTGELDLGTDDNGIQAGFTLHAEHTEDVPLDFSGSGHGRIRALGVTVLGGSVGVDYDSGSGKITATARVEVAGVGKGVDFTIGYLKLGPEALPELGEWNNGVLALNVGSRAATFRRIDPAATDEDFTVESIGAGNSFGEKVVVRAFGTREVFDNVTAIVGDFGTGRDEFRVLPSVGTYRPVAVSIHGGISNDFLLNQSAVPVAFFGDDGDDTLYSGTANDTLSGGAGDDVLDGGAGADSLDGGGDDDTLYWRVGSPIDTRLAGGAGADTLVLVGSDDAEAFVPSSPAVNQLDVAINGTTHVVASDVEAVEIDGRGGADTMTVPLAQLANAGVTSLTLDLSRVQGPQSTDAQGAVVVLADDGAADAVTVVGTEGVDQFRVGVAGGDVSLDTGALALKLVAPSAGDDTLRVEAGGGNDTFDVTGPVGTRVGATLLGEAGGDAFRLPVGSAAFDGGTGANVGTFTVGAGDATAVTVNADRVSAASGFSTYQNLAEVGVEAAVPATITVQSTHANLTRVTLNGGGSVTVNGTAGDLTIDSAGRSTVTLANTANPVTITGASGQGDVVNVGTGLLSRIGGPVTVTNAGTVVYDDSLEGTARNFALNATGLTGSAAGGALTHAGIRTLELNTGTGDDTTAVTLSPTRVVVADAGGRDSVSALLGGSPDAITPQVPDSALLGTVGVEAVSFINDANDGGTAWALNNGVLTGGPVELLDVASAASLGVTLNTGAGNTAVVRATPQQQATTLNLRGGTDLTLGNAQDGLDGLAGPLTITGGGGAVNTLHFDDHAGPFNQGVPRVRTFAPGLATESGLNVAYDPAAFAAVDVQLGPANDAVAFNGAAGYVSVRGGAGNDRFAIGGAVPGAGLSVFGDAGDDTLTLLPGSGQVIFDAGAGTDAATADARSFATPRDGQFNGSTLTVAGVPGLVVADPAGLESLAARLGGGNDTFTVNAADYAADFTVNGGGGDDSITVADVPDESAPTYSYSLVGGSGFDRITLSVPGLPRANQYTVVAPAAEELVIDNAANQSGAVNWSVTGTAVTGNGVNVVDSLGAARVVIHGGSAPGDDALTVAGSGSAPLNATADGNTVDLFEGLNVLGQTGDPVNNLAGSVTVDGLGGARAVAAVALAGGTFVYAGGATDSGVAVFRRDGNNLVAVEVFAPGTLNKPSAIAASPDGKFLYVAFSTGGGISFNELTTLAIDPDTGRLSTVQTVLVNVSLSNISFNVPVSKLLVPSDGLSVIALSYSASGSFTDAVLNYPRNAASGKTGTPVVYSANSTPELSNLRDAFLSDDNRNLYLVSTDHVVHLARATDGTLAPVRAAPSNVWGDNPNGATMPAHADNLQVSPDGKFLFVYDAAALQLSVYPLMTAAVPDLTGVPVTKRTTFFSVRMSRGSAAPFAYDAAMGVLVVMRTPAGGAAEIDTYKLQPDGSFALADSQTPFTNADLQSIGFAVGYGYVGITYRVASASPGRFSADIVLYSLGGDGELTLTVRGLVGGVPDDYAITDKLVAVGGDEPGFAFVVERSDHSASRLIYHPISGRDASITFGDFALALAAPPNQTAGAPEIWLIRSNNSTFGGDSTLQHYYYVGSSSFVSNPTADALGYRNLAFSPDGGAVYLYDHENIDKVAVAQRYRAFDAGSFREALVGVGDDAGSITTLSVGPGGRVYIGQGQASVGLRYATGGAVPFDTANQPDFADGYGEFSFGSLVAGATTPSGDRLLLVNGDGQLLTLQTMATEWGDLFPVAPVIQDGVNGVRGLGGVNAVIRSGNQLFVASGADRGIASFTVVNGVPVFRQFLADTAGTALSDPRALAVAGGTLFVPSDLDNALSAVAFDGTTLGTTTAAVQGQPVPVTLTDLSGAAASADGRYLYGLSAAQSALVVYDTQTGGTTSALFGLFGTPPLVGATLLAATPWGDGTSGDDLVLTLSPSTHTLGLFHRAGGVLTLVGSVSDAALVSAVAMVYVPLGAQGGYLYVATGYGVRRYSVTTTGSVVGSPVVTSLPGASVLYAAGGRVYVGTGTGLRVFDAALTTEYPAVGGLSGVAAIAASGDRVFVAGSGGQLWVFRRAAGGDALTLEQSFREGSAGVAGLLGASAIAVSADGRFVFVAGREEHAIAVFARDAAGVYRFAQVIRDGRGNVNGIADPIALLLTSGTTLWAASASGRGADHGGFDQLTVTPPAPDAAPAQLETRFDNIEQVTINGGADADVARLVRAPTGVTRLTFDLGDGNDTATVQDVGANSLVTTFLLGAGADSLTVNQADYGPRGGTLTVTAGTGDDNLSVQTLAAGTTAALDLSGDTGVDLVRVRGEGLGAGSLVTVIGDLAADAGGGAVTGDALLYAGNGKYSSPTSDTSGTITLVVSGSVSFQNMNRGGPLQQVFLQSAPEPRVESTSRFDGGPVREGDGVRFGADDHANLPGVTFTWDINGDGDFSDATGRQVDLTWDQLRALGITDDGQYSVAVRATTTQNPVQFGLESFQLSADASGFLNIANTAPTLAAPPSDALVGVPYTVSFAATGDPGDDRVTLWQVSWGDGTATESYGADAASATHVYLRPGPVTVTITATDEDGSYAATRALDVGVSAASVSAGGPYATREGDGLTLTATAAGTPTRYLWDLQGDGVSDFTTTTPSLSLTWDQLVAAGVADDGNYGVVVTVEYEANGTTYTAASPPSALVVSNAAPSAGAIQWSSARVAEGSAAGSVKVSIAGAADPSPGDAASLTVRYDFDNDGTLDSPAYNPADLVDVPASVLQSSGTRTVRAVLSDVDGGTRELFATLVVTDVPPAIRLDSPSFATTEGTPVTLTATAADLGGDAVLAWRVNWGDGVTESFAGTTTTFTHTYADGATGGTAYGVTVTAVTAEAEASATATFTVRDAAPAAVLTTATPVVAEGAADGLTVNVAFTDAGRDTVSSYTIDWGDGTAPEALAGGLTNPTHTYADAPAGGVARVRITSITNEDGTFAADSNTLSVTVTNAAPVILPDAVSIPALGQEGSALALAASAASVAAGREPLTFTWTMTDPSGIVVHSATVPGTPFLLADAAHQYAAGGATSFTPADQGTYTVELVVTDDDGAAATLTRTIAVANLAPVVTAFTVPATADEGQPVTLSAAATDAAGAADPLSYTWTVTDRATQAVRTATGATATLALGGGNYAVDLAVSDGDGGVTHRAAQLAVTALPPTLGTFAVPAAADEGQTVTFAASAADPAGTAVAYRWTVTDPDGRVAVLTGPSVDYTFPNDGTYAVRLDATDAGGLAATRTANVVVANVAPTITAVGVPTTGTEGQPLALTATATDPAGTNDARVFHWTVTGPDGTKTEFGESTASFTPPDDGTYTVTLTVSDDDGGSATVAAGTITVANADPVLDPLAAPAGSLEGQTVTLLAPAVRDVAADQAAVGYAWEITLPGGAVITSNEARVSFVAPDNGDYSVTLTVTDRDGGSATQTALFAAGNVNPVLTRVTVPPVGYVGLPLPLTATATDVPADPLSYTWEMTGPDNVARTLAGNTFTPDAVGTYTVTLTVSDGDGGTATQTATLTVEATPIHITQFTVPAAGTEAASLSLSAAAFDALGGTVTYTWTVTPPAGAPITLTGPAPTFTPPDDGAYTVRLVAASVNGQAVNTATVIVANVAPRLGTVTIPNDGTRGVAVALSATATDPADPLSYTWTVTRPDGTAFTLTGTDPTFTPTQRGLYGVRLVASDGDGGTAAASGVVAVIGSTPVASAGGPYTVDESGAIQLDALTGTTDPDDAPPALTYVWDLDGDGVFGEADTAAGDERGATPLFRAPADGPAERTVRVRVTDPEGAASEASAVVAVRNVAPAVAPLALSTATLGPDGLLTVSGTFTDPGADTHTVALHWGDGSPDTVLTLTAGARAFSATHQYADDPVTTGYTVRAAVTDDDGGQGSASAAVALPAAQVVGVTSPDPDGTYVVGSVVTIQVNLNRAVLVSGTPQLPLNSGGTAVYTGGSGTRTLTFTYTVAIGQSSPDLDTAAGAALDLGTGTTLALPAPGAPGSLGASKNLVIDATPIGLTVVGDMLVVTGADTSDFVSVAAAGAQPTGATGVTIRAVLNHHLFRETFTQSFRLIRFDLKGGNNAVYMAGGLTIDADVRADDGNNFVQTARGDDTVVLGTGNSFVDTGDGDDIVTMGDGNAAFFLGAGDDRLTVGDGNVHADGGAGNDVLVTGDGNNHIDAGAGDDFVRTGAGNDQLFGGDGSDVLIAGAGNDRLSGGAGNDLLVGGPGADHLSGDDGDDILIDGTADLTSAGDSYLGVLHGWDAGDDASYADVRSRLRVVYDPLSRDDLNGGAGVDWFWTDGTRDRTDQKRGERTN